MPGLILANNCAAAFEHYQAGRATSDVSVPARIFGMKKGQAKFGLPSCLTSEGPVPTVHAPEPMGKVPARPMSQGFQIRTARIGDISSCGYRAACGLNQECHVCRN